MFGTGILNWFLEVLKTHFVAYLFKMAALFTASTSHDSCDANAMDNDNTSDRFVVVWMPFVRPLIESRACMTTAHLFKPYHSFSYQSCIRGDAFKSIVEIAELISILRLRFASLIGYSINAKDFLFFEYSRTVYPCQTMIVLAEL